ncbi:MAG: GspE/PulE family protein [Desulfobulbaceae bacterium]|nr:GspE/PulE family protein [Desulfobulbaceae bacterium]
MKQGNLKRLLIDSAGISEKVFESYLNLSDLDVLNSLVDENKIDKEKAAEIIASYFNVEYVDLRNVSVDTALFEFLPVVLANRYKCIPLKKVDNCLFVAVSERYSPDIEDRLEKTTRCKIVIKIGSSSAISKALDESGAASRLLESLSAEFSGINGEAVSKREKLGLESFVEEETTITKLINNFLLDAIQKRASDIHIEAQESSVTTKYRIDGVLQTISKPIHLDYHSTIISRLKVLAELDIAEKRVPQDGKFRIEVSGRDIDFRVSILPGAFGEDVVIRILDKNVVGKGKKLCLEDLGFDELTTKNLRRDISEPYGMILITGPTGSGKTTTLYGALSEVNDGTQKIITIEDPIEYLLDGVVQVPVNEKKNLTFSKGLRSILRHDPDKIMVGEIRDGETAEIAIQSALTGHLVFSTVHANNVFDVIGRFSHMGVDVYGFVTALNCVMAQRLVRRICGSCKVEYPIGDEFLRHSLIDRRKYGDHWYKGAGCGECNNTGYKGRVAITEYLKLTPVIREMIVNRRSLTDLYDEAVKGGLVMLRESGIKLAVNGQTTLMEVNRVTFIE